MMSSKFPSGFWLVFLWALLTFTSLVIRPLMPVDETRYASVAWEMWVSHDFLVPHLNGEAYSHKPPLLFWLMQLSWWLFGVNEWTMRMISPLFALATLLLTGKVAKLIWPERSSIAETAPFILLGSGVWIFFSTLTMFDIMLTFFALLGIYSLLQIVNHDWGYRRWLLLGVAIGGGVLTKGPVILLHLLPVTLLAPWWLKFYILKFSWKQWYGGAALAVLTGSAIALSWAIPAGMAGGDAYRNAIFLGQTTGRIVDSFAHKLPFWWYLKILLLFLLPWLLTKPFWLGLTKLNIHDFGVRFCVAWLVPVFLVFSIISGKRIHYLLPLFPGITLLLAFAFDQLTDIGWRKANAGFLGLLLLLSLLIIGFPWLNDYFHWRDDFSRFSMGWGIALFIVVLLLAILPVKDLRQSVSVAATASVCSLLIISGGFFSINRERFDITPSAKKMAEVLAKQPSLVFYSGRYHGQFQFAGRLTRPLPIIPYYVDLLTHAAKYPDDLIAVIYANPAPGQESLFSYRFPLKGQNVGFIQGKTLLDNPKIAQSFLR